MSSNPPTLDDNGTQSAAATPAVDIPGAFPPEEESLYPQTQSQAKPPLERTTSGDGVKDKVHHTAENYIAPERLDQAEHFVEGVGSKAAQYVPAGVANVVSSYWYGSSKSSASNTSARADSGANGNGTTALPTAEKDSSADEAGVATLSDDPSDNITAAASTATASSAAATDKGASSKNIAGKTAADTSISGESSSTTGTLDGSAGSVKATPTSTSTSTATAKLPAVEDAPTKASAPAPTPAPVPVSEVPSSSEPIAAQPAEASTTPSSTDAVTSAAAAAPQEQTIETSKDTISPQDANEIPKGKDDGAKKDDEKAATAVASAAAAAPQEQAIETSKDTIPPQDANEIPKGKDDGAKKDAAAGVGAGLAGLGAGVAAMGLGDKDKKEDASQPVANLTPRRYALGSLPPVDRGDAASASEDSSVGRVDGARGAWDVAENRVVETKKVENTGLPPKAAEDGIVGNSGGDNGDAKMDDDTNRKYADRISGLQALVQDGVAHDTSAKARVDDVFTPAPAAPSEDSAKPKDLKSDRGYHPAQLHPYTPNASSTASGITSASSSPRHPSLTRNTPPSTSTKDKHGHVHQRTVSTSSVGSGSPRRKKVGFFDKVRGEAKVIVGKIEHKKEKVEEGKRILHGED